MNITKIIEPHGGELTNQEYSINQLNELQEKAKKLRKITIDKRYINDCELIQNGAYSPLKGFMTHKEVKQVFYIIWNC